MIADKGHLQGKVGGQRPLYGDVPGLHVPLRKILGDVDVRLIRRVGDDAAGGQLNRVGRGSAGGQGPRGNEGISGTELVGLGNGEVIDVGIPHQIADAVAAAKHGLLVEAISQAEARAEALFLVGDSQVVGDAAQAGQLQRVVERVVVGKAGRVVRRARGPVFPAQAQVQRQLLGDLPLVQKVQVVNRIAARGKDNRQVAADLVGLIEQEGCEGVAETGGRIAVERRRPRRENESSARVEHLCLNDVLTLAANIGAPFDHVRALRLGPVIDKVEIGDRAPPRQAIDETDDGVGVAVDLNLGEAARPVVQIDVGNADVLGSSQTVVDVGGLIAIPHDAEAELHHQRGAEDTRVVETGALVARGAGSLKAAVMRASVDASVGPV